LEINFCLNGKNKTVEIKPNELLSDLLRRLGNKEVKIGCKSGDCGSCTVLINGKPMNSCLILAPKVDNLEVTTIKGIGTINSPHPLQAAYAEAGAVQCGFCTPGSIISAYSLLRNNKNPDNEEIKTALSGNICRCTGYYKQIEAVKIAAENLGK
jgi:carbon-monoxide dehydrogenase small subunit